MADKVEADDSVKLGADEKKGSDCNTPEEGMGQTYSGHLDTKHDAERGATPIPEQVPTSTIRLEGTRLLSIIPVKVKARKYQESIGTCSPFSPEPLEDCKLSSCVFLSPSSTAAAVGGESSGFASAKDEQLAVAQETKSNDSFVVVKDGNKDVNIKEDKEEKETATPGGTSATEQSTGTSRKKKGGISALTLALQREKAKQAAAQQAAAQQAAAQQAAAQQAAEGASGSELKNDTGNEGSTSIQQNTRPRPVRIWGPDGRPIVQENDQDSNFRADELVTPLVFRLCEDGRVRCFFEVPVSRDVTPDSDPPMGPNVDEAAAQQAAAQQAAAQQAAAQQAAEGASGSELKNDTGNEGSTSIQQNTRPRPVRIWGPDGRPIVQENDQDSNFRADELVTPLVFRLCEDGRVRCFFEVPVSRDVTPDSDPPMGPNVDEMEQPSMCQRCLMWCERLFCCRDYEPL